MRDIFSRDTQRDMGQPYTRSRYYHLYINGQYWGLYQTDERPRPTTARPTSAATTRTTTSSRSSPDPTTIEATDGNLDAWRRLWQAAPPRLRRRTPRTSRLQGNNPDGTDNPAYEVLLDVDNLIDYMLVILYTGNLRVMNCSPGVGVV